MDSTVTRLLIVDDHLLIRDALARMLSASPGLEIVGAAASIRETLVLWERTAPDLLLVDLWLEDGSGIELTRTLRRSRSKPRVLIVTGFRDRFSAEEALAAGVSGYILKEQPTSDLLAAIEAVSRGRTYISPVISAGLRVDREPKDDDGPLTRLSRRENEIFRRVVVGSSTKEISASLFISAKTVETHRTNINRKLGVRSTAGLLRFAATHGIAIAANAAGRGSEEPSASVERT